MFGAPSTPATPSFGGGGGLFGAPSTPAANTTSGLFGQHTPGGGGAFTTPGAGSNLFGAASPSPATNLFAAPATQGGGGSLFGATQNLGAFGTSSQQNQQQKTAGLFGTTTAAAPAATYGGGFFGTNASQPVASFAAPSIGGGGGLFSGFGGGGFGGGLQMTQPNSSFLAMQPQPAAAVPILQTTNGAPITPRTQWSDLTPASQQRMKEIEKLMATARDESDTLEAMQRARRDAFNVIPESETSTAHVALKSLSAALVADTHDMERVKNDVTATLRHAERATAMLSRLAAASGGAAPPQAPPQMQHQNQNQQQNQLLGMPQSAQFQSPAQHHQQQHMQSTYYPPPLRPSLFFNGNRDVVGTQS